LQYESLGRAELLVAVESRRGLRLRRVSTVSYDSVDTAGFLVMFGVASIKFSFSLCGETAGFSVIKSRLKIENLMYFKKR
jgi:hypothetical protein